MTAIRRDIDLATSTVYHEDTKAHEKHENIFVQGLLRDLRALRDFVMNVCWDQPRCRVRPTMQMPASSAVLRIASPSIISVFPASTDSRSAPTAFIASIVETPITGTSNRMS